MRVSRDATVALALFDSPLPAAWQAAQIESMTASERARLARIHRALRCEQFIVGHALLRRLLMVLGFDAAVISVNADGRPSVEGAMCQVSIAHSAGAVAAIVAPGTPPIGIDIEAARTLRDPPAAAAWLGMSDPAVDSEQVLTAWVAAEAVVKAGLDRPGAHWQSRWQDYLIAVAGVAQTPQTLVFDAMTGTYNRAELRWNTVESAAKQQG